MKAVRVALGLFAASVLMARGSWAEDRDFELAFDSGSRISTVQSNSVVRGDRDRYYFTAGAGQRISIAISSLEDNAAFQLLYDQGGSWTAVPEMALGGNVRVFYGVLPDSDSGRYRIDVGGVRGNAAYDLFVGIAAISP